MRVAVENRMRGDLSRIPFPANGLVEQLRAEVLLNGAETLDYVVPAIPKSLNHQYKRHSPSCWDLDPAQKAFRDTFAWSLKGKSWAPKGATAAVILFYSPEWLTKARTIRRLDVDNMIKAVLDAQQICTGADDADNWSVFAMKILSNHAFTRVLLFDVGDVVPMVQFSGTVPFGGPWV